MSLLAATPGTTVVVTGASSGIGTALAQQLSSRGHHVTIVARRANLLDEVAEHLPQESLCLPCDLGDPAAREELIAALVTGPAIVGLCNSAGVGGFGAVHMRDLAAERAMVDLNVGATHHLTAALLPAMVARGAGAILNVSSGAGFVPIPWTATYAATKAFITNFSQALHAELAGSGVSVTAICPGPVDSGFMEAAGAADSAENLPAFMRGTADGTARAGIEGMVRGVRIVNPLLTDKINMAAGRLTPSTVMLPVLNRVMRRRIDV